MINGRMAIGSNPSLINRALPLLMTSVIAFGLVAPQFAQAAAGEYDWTRTLPNSTSEYNVQYHAMSVSADGRTVAIVNDSGIYVSRDYGETWPIGSTPTYLDGSNLDLSSVSVYGLSMSGDGEKLAFAISDSTNNSTLIYLSTDYGVTWSTSAVTDGTDTMGINIHDFTMSSDGNVLVVSGADDVPNPQTFVSRDFGATWILGTNLEDGDGYPIGIMMASSGESSIAVNDDGSIFYVVDEAGTVHKSIDYGSTWVQQTNTEGGVPNVNASPSISTNDDGSKVYVFAHTYDTGLGVTISGIYCSIDSGTTWTLKALPSNVAYIAAISIGGEDDDTVYVVGGSNNDGKGFWRSFDGGASWEQNTTLSITDPDGNIVDNPAFQYIHVGSDAQHIAILSSQYGFYISNDGSSTWSKPVASGSTRYGMVTSSSDGETLAAIGGGMAADDYQYMNTVYVSVDRGLTWTPHTIAYTDPYGNTQSIYAAVSLAMSADGKNMIATTLDYPVIFVSSDYGDTWTQRDAPSWVEVDANGDSTSVQVYAADVAIDNIGNRVAILDDAGQVFVSTDFGSTWTQTTQITWIDSEDNINQAGQTYSVAMSNDGQKIAVVASEAASLGGGVYISSDGGSTWAHPTITDSSNVAFYGDYDSGGVGSLVAVSDDGNRMAVGGVTQTYDGDTNLWTYEYFVITSNDAGTTWSNRVILSDSSPASNTAPIISMNSDGSMLLAAVDAQDGSQNYLFTSTDFGSTWTAQTAAGSRYWGTTAISDDGSQIIAAQYSSSGSGPIQSGAIFIGTLSGAITPVDPTDDSDPDVSIAPPNTGV